MQITMIAAISSNGVIGVGNSPPWCIPEDLRYFKEYTAGKTIVLGYNTYKSIGSKPLPYRNNIVISSSFEDSTGVIKVCRSPLEALDYAKKRGVEELVIIGGSQIYKQMMPVADKLVITHVEVMSPYGVFFPEIKENMWRVDKLLGEGLSGGLEYEIKTYKRW